MRPPQAGGRQRARATSAGTRRGVLGPGQPALACRAAASKGGPAHTPQQRGAGPQKNKEKSYLNSAKVRAAAALQRRGFRKVWVRACRPFPVTGGGRHGASGGACCKPLCSHSAGSVVAQAAQPYGSVRSAKASAASWMPWSTPAQVLWSCEQLLRGCSCGGASHCSCGGPARQRASAGSSRHAGAQPGRLRRAGQCARCCRLSLVAGSTHRQGRGCACPGLPVQPLLGRLRASAPATCSPARRPGPALPCCICAPGGRRIRRSGSPHTWLVRLLQQVKVGLRERLALQIVCHPPGEVVARQLRPFHGRQALKLPGLRPQGRQLREGTARHPLSCTSPHVGQPPQLRPAAQWAARAIPWQALQAGRQAGRQAVAVPRTGVACSVHQPGGQTWHRGRPLPHVQVWQGAADRQASRPGGLLGLAGAKPCGRRDRHWQLPGRLKAVAAGAANAAAAAAAAAAVRTVGHVARVCTAAGPQNRAPRACRPRA